MSKKKLFNPDALRKTVEEVLGNGFCIEPKTNGKSNICVLVTTNPKAVDLPQSRKNATLQIEDGELSTNKGRREFVQRVRGKLGIAAQYG